MPFIYAKEPSRLYMIELSIVLVIIGLIVGGILAGQELIRTAAARAQVAQITAYNSAVNDFRGKYGGLPGDLALNLANQFGFATPADCTGQAGGRDGNGLIDGHASYVLAAVMGENILFWMDLDYAKIGGVHINLSNNNVMLNPNCTNSVTVTDTGQVLPAGKIGYGTDVHVFEQNGSNWYLPYRVDARCEIIVHRGPEYTAR